jgi:hypothetical protein
MPIHKKQKLVTAKFITVVMHGRQSLQKSRGTVSALRCKSPQTFTTPSTNR